MFSECSLSSRTLVVGRKLGEGMQWSCNWCTDVYCMQCTGCMSCICTRVFRRDLVLLGSHQRTHINIYAWMHYLRVNIPTQVFLVWSTRVRCRWEQKAQFEGLLSNQWNVSHDQSPYTHFLYTYMHERTISIPEVCSLTQLEDFLSEAATMLKFDHPNVLKMEGVCFDTENGLPIIVLPLMINGDLKSFLVSKRSNVTAKITTFPSVNSAN